MRLLFLPICLPAILGDLFILAARLLVMHGRLVFWVPADDTFENSQIEEHPCLKLVAVRYIDGSLSPFHSLLNYQMRLYFIRLILVNRNIFRCGRTLPFFLSFSLSLISYLLFKFLFCMLVVKGFALTFEEYW